MIEVRDECVTAKWLSFVWLKGKKKRRGIQLEKVSKQLKIV
jgi:hypothetical protein